MSNNVVHILSGGAAFGLIGKLRDEFENSAGCRIGGHFGAVGAMKQKLLDGEACDVLILTQAMIRDLQASGLADKNHCVDLGPVATSIAIRAGDPQPGVGNGEQLAAALLAADAIYFPDPKLATAGIHFASVLESLRISAQVAAKLRPFPNGATAMAAMAAHAGGAPIGCTQTTEILATPGVQLIAPLPVGYALATVYTAAAATGAQNREAACQLVDLLGAVGSAAQRRAAGFEV